MKRLIITLLIGLFLAPLYGKDNWTQGEAREIAILRDQCINIICQNTSASPSGRSNILFIYLRNVGTPASLKVLKELVAQGQVEAYVLNSI